MYCHGTNVCQFRGMTSSKYQGIYLLSVQLQEWLGLIHKVRLRLLSTRLISTKFLQPFKTGRGPCITILKTYTLITTLLKCKMWKVRIPTKRILLTQCLSQINQRKSRVSAKNIQLQLESQKLGTKNIIQNKSKLHHTDLSFSLSLYHAHKCVSLPLTAVTFIPSLITSHTLM